MSGGTSDQHLIVQPSTQMATEGNSSELRSAMSSSTDTTATQGSGYFNFTALPRELRDMIYDQFQRLPPDNPMFCKAGQPEIMASQPVRSKSITSLLLVNKKISLEYRDACEKRLGVIVSSSMDNLAPGAEFEEEIYPWDTEKASFIHMHAGDWMYRDWIDDPEWTLSSLRDWLAHQDLRMPNLDSITVSIYLRLGSIEKADERKKLEKALEDFVSLPRLKTLKVITMDNALSWSTSESGPSSKKLLYHWTPGAAQQATLIDSPESYVETCCKCLEFSNSDLDDFSSHSDNDNDDDDGDQGNDSDDGGNSENSDEEDDAGKSSRGDTNNGDEEPAENADEDANEDSGEKSSGADDTTRDSQTAQTPSYFNFSNLPPEIRDMIYDQPEMLEQETPLCRRMAGTKPRTSLLLVNNQSSSEYKNRCEGRSRLFISEKLDCFIRDGHLIIPWAAAQDATFMHNHAGEWRTPSTSFAGTYLWHFGQWLSHFTSQMPKLENASVNLYTTRHNGEHPLLRNDFVRHLTILTSMAQVIELGLVIMEELLGQPEGWLLWLSKNAAKTLLAHWKRGSDISPQVMDLRVSREENCCEGSLTRDLLEDKDEDDEEDVSLDHTNDGSTDDDE